MAYYTNVEDMNCWYVSICVKFENYPGLISTYAMIIVTLNEGKVNMETN
jgi:hypothetical protein